VSTTTLTRSLRGVGGRSLALLGLGAVAFVWLADPRRDLLPRVLVEEAGERRELEHGEGRQAVLGADQLSVECLGLTRLSAGERLGAAVEGGQGLHRVVANTRIVTGVPGEPR